MNRVDEFEGLVDAVDHEWTWSILIIGAVREVHVTEGLEYFPVLVLLIGTIEMAYIGNQSSATLTEVCRSLDGHGGSLTADIDKIGFRGMISKIEQYQVKCSVLVFNHT